MKRIWLTLFVLFISARAFADERSSVLIAAEQVHQGSLPQIVTAYGTVEPLPDGATNISLLRAGRVDKISVNLGQQVKQGDTLLTFTSNLSTLLTYDQAVTALDAAKKEQARTQRLLTERLANQSQMTQANKAVSDAEAVLEVEKKQGSNLKTQMLSAPYDGTITNISVNSGDRVAAYAVLLQLTHGNGLAVGLGLPLDDRANIQIGQFVQLTALDVEKAAITGNVAFVGNILAPKTRLVKVLVTVPSEAATGLVSGEQFRADIEIGKLTGVIVPRQAVLKDDKGQYIFQVNGIKATRVNIKIVGESGDDYVIDGSIDATKKIVTEGNYELKDGNIVRKGDRSDTKAEP